MRIHTFAYFVSLSLLHCFSLLFRCFFSMIHAMVFVFSFSVSFFVRPNTVVPVEITQPNQSNNSNIEERKKATNKRSQFVEYNMERRRVNGENEKTQQQTIYLHSQCLRFVLFIVKATFRHINQNVCVCRIYLEIDGMRAEMPCKYTQWTFRCHQCCWHHLEFLSSKNIECRYVHTLIRLFATLTHTRTAKERDTNNYM